ncbi:MAG: type II secretion system F family protein [Rickettsiales bacterium]|nr:type II secretion system F family protein [Rickettsiales bacterium]
MEPLVVIGTGAIVFLLLSATALRLLPDRGEQRTKSIIDQIATGSDDEPSMQDDGDAAAHFKEEATGLTRVLLSLPGAESFYAKLLKAGHAQRIKSVLLIMVSLFVVLSIILAFPFGPYSLLFAGLLTYYIPKKFFTWEIKKRNRKFIDQFPEAIDMIVRSVKSGHPLNTALRMIADNMEAPVAPEFRQLVNEIAYGRPLVDALRRLAKRVDEQDVHFFVVVLAVQQETGGNLAEILKNLSNVIRGRKRLQQKISAMTSEGKATLVILGALPVLVFCAIQFTSPQYLQPLYDTLIGNIILSAAIGLILMAIFIINKMIDIDI